MHFNVLRSDGEDNMADISKVGPGAYGAGGETHQLPSSIYMERMCTDINSLKKQYDRLKQRQNQAHIIIAAASATQQQQQKKPKIITPKIETPTALNHLFVGRNNGTRNRCVTASPRIASVYPQLHGAHPQPGSRKNSVSKGNRLDPDPKVQRSKSPNTVTAVSIEPKSHDNEKDENKQIDNNHNLKISNLCKTGVADSPDLIHQTNITHESNTWCENAQTEIQYDGKVLNGNDIENSYSSLDNSENSSAVSNIFSSHDSHVGVNVGVTSSCSEVNQNSNNLEKCNSNSTDSPRQSSNTDSECVHGCLDSSNDSGLFSGTSSTELGESPGSIVQKSEEKVSASVNSENSIKPAQRKSNEKMDKHMISSDAQNDNKISAVSRSISEDVCSHQEADDKMTSRSRSFSTDQALSDYARSKNKPTRMTQPFNPFPVKHFNENRKKNCVKLGLYKTSTLQEFERQCKSKFLWSK